MARHPRATLVFWVFALLLTFNIAMPKGGIALGENPLTIGYFLAAAIAPIALVGLALRGNIATAPLSNLMFGYIPVTLIALLKLLQFGSTYGVLIYLTIFAILPTMMLLIYAPYLSMLRDDQVRVVLRWCIRFVVIWGLLNFFLFAFTRYFIEIPYLTVNPMDAGEIYSKNNRRGILMKLVSTYNNGNIYGACLGMLAPLYFASEKSRVFIVLFCIALVLTLSRTAWFVMLCIMALLVVTGQVRVAKWQVVLGLVGVCAMVIALLPFMNWTSDRLVESDLGGRMVQWTDIEPSLFGAETVRVSEVLYAGLLQSFGILGTILALVALGFPILYGASRWRQLGLLQRASVLGLIVYLLAAFSDAAFIYPPTMMIFLFVSAMVYRPSETVAAPDPAPVTQARRAGLTRGPLTLAEASARLR